MPVARETTIAQLLLLEVPLYRDSRGFFCETYVRSKYQALGITETFVQDSLSWSARGVLRGMHGDRRMSKLVRVLYGEIYDVVADARRDSPTYGQWEAFELSQQNGHQLYVPPGCLHGFFVRSDFAAVAYKQSAEYDPTMEIAALWSDKGLNIRWPDADRRIVSEKDECNSPFSHLT